LFFFFFFNVEVVLNHLRHAASDFLARFQCHSHSYPRWVEVRKATAELRAGFIQSYNDKSLHRHINAQMES
jgi:hypothetical protein